MWGKGNPAQQFKYVPTQREKERKIPQQTPSLPPPQQTQQQTQPKQMQHTQQHVSTHDDVTTTQQQLASTHLHNTTTIPNAKRQLKDLVIYCAFVRNHGPKGTFAELEKDLPRIKSIGVDMLWLLPIYPIGEIQRKGPQGSPYSIKDFRGINPNYGTMEDFERLVSATHSAGMMLMMDIVFNHTSHDNKYIKEHPEWYHRDHTGKPTARVERWYDIIDLNFNDRNNGLWEELVSVLEFWVRKGVDGFRCDVAKMVPLDFWIKARSELAKINPDLIWLAESGKHMHIERNRAELDPQIEMVTDAELYKAFDISYDYDTWSPWMSLMSGKIETKLYLEMLRMQATSLPATAEKMRFVENHDTARIMHVTKKREQAVAWTAFTAFNSGPFLIYAGQESESKHAPTLFDYDKINFGSYSLQPLLTKLVHIKKLIHSQKGAVLYYLDHKSAIVACWKVPGEGTSVLGVFNVRGAVSGPPVDVFLADGVYKDAIYETDVPVVSGAIPLPADFTLLYFTGDKALKKCKHFNSFLIY